MRIDPNSLKLAVAVLTGSAMFTSPSASGGIRRDDVPDASYTALGADSRYASVGKLNPGFLCSGVLIQSDWVLTAAHCIPTNGVAPTFEINGTTYVADEWMAHPNYANDSTLGYDLGLVHLTQYVAGVTPALRYTQTSEIGKTGTIVGFGRTGTGLTGDNAAGGIKRAGTNVLDLSGTSFGISSRVVLADLDNPNNAGDNWFGSATPTALEYGVANGDSGGGVFVDFVEGSATVTRLVAVSSFLSAHDAAADGDYGDASAFTRVGTFDTWITTTTSSLATQGWNSSAGGTWSNASNWNTGKVPTETRDASFNRGATYTVNLTAPAQARNVTNVNDVVTFNRGNQLMTIGGKLAIAETGGTAKVIVQGTASGLSVGTLAIGSGGKLDLTNTAMVVKNSTLAAVDALVTSGYHNGDWLGSGIVSSTAANDPSELTAVGYASNGELGATAFKGVTGLDSDDVLVRFTYYGDADLNGVVDPDDFNQFLAGFQDSSLPRTWVYGDFDYNNVIDPDDFNIFLAAFQANGSPLSALVQSIELSTLSAGDQHLLLGAIAAVPEPGTLGILGVAACGCLTRRRRNAVA